MDFYHIKQSPKKKPLRQSSFLQKSSENYTNSKFFFQSLKSYSLKIKHSRFSSEVKKTLYIIAEAENKNLQVIIFVSYSAINTFSWQAIVVPKYCIL